MSAIQKIEFSRARKTEGKELTSFLAAVFAGEYERDVIKPDVDMSFQEHIFAYHFFIGREGKKIVCTGALKKSGLERDLWGIAWVAVAPSQQRQGYGRRMVDHLIYRFASEKLLSPQGTIILSAKKHNCAFYSKLGFKSVKAHGGNWLFYKKVGRSKKRTAE